MALQEVPLPDSLAEVLAERLRLVAQPLRLRLIHQLHADGEMTVQALADAVGATQQNVSKHLGRLYDHGVVRRRQDGRCAWYSLADPAMLALCDVARAGLGERLDDLLEDRGQEEVHEARRLAHRETGAGSGPRGDGQRHLMALHLR